MCRARPRILVAEDDHDMRSLLVMVLSEKGYHIEEASTGDELFHRLDRPDHVLPDLVISDVRMPGRTGLEVLEAVHMRKLKLPVIMITAFGDRETHQKAYASGAQLVLDKPFDMKRLCDEVERLLGSAVQVMPADECGALGCH